MFTMNSVPDPIIESALMEIEMGLNMNRLVRLEKTTSVDMLRAILKGGLMNAVANNQARLRKMLLTDSEGFSREMWVHLPAGEIRERWENPGGAR